jgi:hypothetical protein
MPPLPPLKDVLEALYQGVLPGAGGAALVLAAFLLLGRWAAALGSAVAVCAAFVWGNFVPPNLSVLTWENSARLLHWKPGADAPGPQWLPRAALVLVAVGLLSRWLGSLADRFLADRARWAADVLVWLPRGAAVFAVTAWLVLGKAAEAGAWAYLRWELAAAMLLLWPVLDALARRGFGAEVAAYLGAGLFAGAAVLLYAQNANFMELAVLIGSAMFGIAVVAARGVPGAAPADVHTTGAIPAGVAFLPGLLLGTRPSHADNQVPDICFWLVALAPLLLAPVLVPRIGRQNRWALLALRAALVAAPLLAAVALAARHETLPFD